jgi:hypothetical protein
MFKKDISDAEMDINNKRILSTIPLIKTPKLNNTLKQNDVGKVTKLFISNEEKMMLSDIHLRPFINTTERYATLYMKGKPLSPAKGTRLINKLTRLNLVTKHTINISSGRGGHANFLELTQNAYKAIDITPKNIGIGGFEHRYWQHVISKELKSKPNIKNLSVESKINEKKSVDILIALNDERIIAVEIALTSGHEKDNILKDIENGCSQVIIACKDKKIMKQVREMLPSTDERLREKVQVCLVQNLVQDFNTLI